MALIQEQHHCPTCNQPRLFTKAGTNHLVHALVSLFLCGLWIPIWILAALMNGGNPLRCTQCGSTIRGGQGVGAGGIIAAAFAVLIIGSLLVGAIRRTGEAVPTVGRSTGTARVVNTATNSPAVTFSSQVAPDAEFERGLAEQREIEAQRRAKDRKSALDAAALKLHQELAAKGEPYGIYQMGRRYATGDGVEKDEKRGQEYLERAAKFGSVEASALLKKLYPAPVEIQLK